MTTSVLDEIQQRRPFDLIEEEAAVGLMRTAALLQDDIEALMRGHGVTGAQYNVLRILRGAGDAGLGRNDIRDRLLSRMPDVTRLLDRTEEAGLVTRTRLVDDRRCVHARITPSGLALLAAVDRPLKDVIVRRFAGLDPEGIRGLIDALGRVRGA